MTITDSSAAAHSSRLPDGVTIQPRTFRFDAIDSVPQYWFSDNPLLTHMENAFSILIPPGERFFIESVRNFQDQARDSDLGDLIRAFVQQEALHMRAHDEFNESIAEFGIDVKRERRLAERAIGRLPRWLPRKMQLGATAFLEHLTATGAHMLFLEPEMAAKMHPEMLRFWRWHAAEELEHKAVAFDLFREVGGGYGLRVLSALAAVAILTVPMVTSFRRMLKEDGVQVTDAMRSDARSLNKKIMGPQLRMLAAYFKPSFHPWDFDDQKFLAEWYDSPEVSAAG